MTTPSRDDFFEEDQLFSETCGAIGGVVDIGAIKPGDELAPLVTGMLRGLGEDPSREGLLKTPRRVEAAMRYLTKGYSEDLSEIVNGALFDSSNEDIVLVKDIDIFSLCEHHLLPFYGKAHIAYIPSGKVIGISKLPRIADMFARRLQIQENLTQQIADALDKVLAPRGVAVVVEAAHMCMVMRGVQKVGAMTVTRALTGLFKTDSRLRRELSSMLGKPTT
ncbi:MAG: GTP cyclohydrolase 1 [Planctomycetes bacterium]|nr:GTP cyclohydrolase 1 [Planctomycetota bacterium]GIK53883.1 MAG: GTP cyclohydrolase 1 [Planctomycetota bacterium]HRJ78304.1 GTP cyclohydrolase I FolE [Planctomycetota bacterium]